MTVCVTGDVHHMSLETRDQTYMDRTELEAAIEYAEIAAEHGVPVTLFVTGKAAREEPDRVRRLVEMNNVEIGGHDYYAFDTVVHNGWRLLERATGGLIGSWNGPARFQDWEIQRTKETLDGLGADVVSWRNHAYRHDHRTHELLARNGFTHASNAVGPDEGVRTQAGVTVVPVNTPPDHEHVYHAFRTPEYVADSDFEGPFGAESWSIEKWLDHVLAVVSEGSGDPTTVLAHPSCMALADGFAAFERLCRTLNISHDARHVSEVENRMASF